jgi:very-short-patch-repair endonuclease
MMVWSMRPKRALAKRMRRGPTSQEARLWDLLRDRRLAGLKFRRQVPLGPYVVDFLSFHRRLVVEVDGPFHGDDSARDAWLGSQGFRVLRFATRQVAEATETVLEAIRTAAEAPLLVPSPLMGEGGGEADG